MFAKLTDRAQKVLTLAKEEARRFFHEYIGTEHLLLGLVAEGTGIAANVLKNLGIDPQKIRREISKLVHPGVDASIVEEIPMTPRSQKVIEYAIGESRELGHNYVGTEHLLLGLMREQEGVASQVLMNLGLRRADLREEILAILTLPAHGDEGSAVDSEHLAANDKHLQHLPAPAREIAEEFQCQIDVVQEGKEDAISAQDWPKAAALRDLQEKLTKLLADFLRQWPASGATP
jgi:ATP-dependent Clp protease ATP-binding subunit ClpC